MCRLRSLAVAVFTVSCLVGSARADLNGDIKGVLANKLLVARVGIEIVKLSDRPDDCRIVYQHNAHALLIPASNMKLLTTSAALHVLTPQFRFRTMLVRDGNDLVLWGDGDPTLGDAELMDKIGWSQTAVFDDWADQLTKRKITAINNVVVDDSIFDKESLHPRWTKHQFDRRARRWGAELQHECAGVSGQGAAGDRPPGPPALPPAMCGSSAITAWPGRTTR